MVVGSAVAWTARNPMNVDRFHVVGGPALGVAPAVAEPRTGRD